MKKQEDKHIISIDQFDEEISLHQLIPSGTGTGLKHLKTIVNSILNNPEQERKKLLSLLVISKEGARTHGRSFLRALGLEDIREIPAQLIHSQHIIHEFFNPLFMPQSFFVSDINALHSSALKTIHQIISKGQYTDFEPFKKATETVFVHSPLVMTARDSEKIPHYFKEKVDHIVTLDEYTTEQLELIVLQRLKYCGLDYEKEEVLSSLVESGCGYLHIIIRLLKDAITLILSENRSVLTVDDVKKAMSYS